MSLRNPERGLFSVKGLIFSLGLIASFIFVGVIYGGLIRPAANEAALAQSYGVEASSSSGIYVILKDYEQQVCISLFVWGIMILVYKFILVSAEAKALGRFAPESEGIDTEAEVDLLAGARSITRERAGKLSEEIDQKSKSHDLKNKILPYVMARGLERYHMTGNVPEATETIMGRLEVASEQQESELSMLRYLVWAIPSIGFIGTVRGIGVALHRADEALQGDISGVTGALGVAFNSTLVALIISIALMLLIHLLQSGQEGLILRVQTFCREQIIDKLYDRDESDASDIDIEVKTVLLEDEASSK
ncbi:MULTISPECIES: MotA/TolQ/ExbB proton channel family protein [unclassified Lentimonas]|uniref:MotA/TolQ/ExbB proton channel family protein n=1 Tax=unclassified Lentimonas TaxID=2630993 RepID=UPI001323A923|nr:MULTISPECIES: MotA/TolQ/ExbB proton channel family protein [unclassified Lentimonas]CAA6691519.1 Possible biopolymer transport protein, ExbB family [Lentimonas sp. CC10]CAA6696178.1 Possible biopolymer transport protein, ExbB family [Lentimonas sp. CC19]CAA7070904.1 Possible biopolymer transport protein, ExbB family [Lentimonas sp. CC11]